MKTLISYLALTLCCLGSEVEISEHRGFRIEHCHVGDEVIVEVAPVDSSKPGGFFRTTNAVLRLRELSMAPTGTNVLSLRTVCQGMTSDVRRVVVVVKRKPPAPVVRRVGHGGAQVVTMPPMPGGLVIAGPLPGGTNADYSTMRQRR